MKSSRNLFYRIAIIAIAAIGMTQFFAWIYVFNQYETHALRLEAYENLGLGLFSQPWFILVFVALNVLALVWLFSKTRWHAIVKFILSLWLGLHAAWSSWTVLWGNWYWTESQGKRVRNDARGGVGVSGRNAVRVFSSIQLIIRKAWDTRRLLLILSKNFICMNQKVQQQLWIYWWGIERFCCHIHIRSISGTAVWIHLLDYHGLGHF